MNPDQIRKSSLAVAVALFTSATAVAQEPPPAQATLMNQVTVTATRTERALDDVASSVSVVTAADAEKDMARNIRDLVKYEPGITVASDSRFGLGGFNIRGMDENRIKISVDGVSQAKAYGYDRSLQSQRNFFDIESMKQLEVVKGPASSVHGSDAIGGVAAFITKDPADFLEANGDDTYLSLKGGYNSSDSSLAETFTIANRTGDLESLLIYTHRDGKETETYGGRGGIGESREQADPLDYASDSVLGKLQYQINDNHRIGFTAEWQDSRTTTNMLSAYGETIDDVPGFVQRHYTNQFADDQAERIRLGFVHEWQADFVAFDDLKWSLDWQNSKSTQKTWDAFNMIIGGIHLPATNRLKTYSYEEQSIQADAVFNKVFTTGEVSHFATYGLNVEDKMITNNNNGIDLETGEELTGSSAVSNWMPEVGITSFGLFAQNEISLMNDRLTVTPGVRYDRFDETIEQTDGYSGSTPKDQTYNSFTGRLGSVFEINDTWSTFAQYSQGFSTPDMFAKYFNYEKMNVVVLANPDLKPEESSSIEVGLRANNHMGGMEVTAFYSDYTNFIEEAALEYNSPTDATFQYRNLSDATIRGIEFKGMLWLDTAIGAPQGTRFNSAIAWSEGRGTKEDKGVIHENEPLNTIAPLTAVFSLGYDAPSETWGSEVMWTLVTGKDSNEISNINDVSMGGDLGEDKFAPSGYGVVDLTAYYKPHEDVTLNVGIFNAFDKQYWVWDDVRNLTHTYEGLNRYTQPGRNYSVSVKWEI